MSLVFLSTKLFAFLNCIQFFSSETAETKGKVKVLSKGATHLFGSCSERRLSRHPSHRAPAARGHPESRDELERLREASGLLVRWRQRPGARSCPHRRRGCWTWPPGLRVLGPAQPADWS